MQFVSLGQLVHLLSFSYEWSLAGTTFSQVDCDCVAYKVFPGWWVLMWRPNLRELKMFQFEWRTPSYLDLFNKTNRDGNRYLLIMVTATITSPFSGVATSYERHPASLRLNSTSPLFLCDALTNTWPAFLETEREGRRGISWDERMAREIAQVGGQEGEVADNY